jgi:FkbM family methyltransferase
MLIKGIFNRPTLIYNRAILFIDYFIRKTILKRDYDYFNTNRGKLLLKVSNDIESNYRRLNIYEPITEKSFKRVLKPGMLVVEAGASEGYFSLLISNLIGGSGKLICFEPFPKYFWQLSTNVKINNKTNVVLENKGLSNENGIINFDIDSSTSYNGIQDLYNFKTLKVLNDGTKSSNLVAVDVIKLSDYIKTNSLVIDLLFTDVEGCEKMIFEDLIQNVEFSLLPKFILFESHPGFYGKEIQQELLNNFRKIGYQIENTIGVHYFLTKMG